MSFDYFDIKSGCPFQPVQCSEATFQSLTPEDGHVYFTTDTKKIFLGKNSEAIQMCGATGFFYGTKEIEYDNSGNTPDPNVAFYFHEIEGNEIPQKDDLILNVDGCFYRVKEITEDEVHTTRLTLQGSGVGPGGGGGGGSTASFKIAAVGGANKVFSTTTDKAEIGFIANYSGDISDNYISTIECTMKDETEPFYAEYDAHRDFNTNQTIDLIDCLERFSTSKKSFTLKVQDKYGEERSMTFSIQLVELFIEATQSDMLYSMEREYNYDCQVSGGKVLSNRKLTYTLYSENNLFTPVDSSDYLTTDEGNVQKKINLNKCSHGTYILTIQASGTISGGGTVKSNILTHKLIYFDNSVGDPIFAVLLPEKTEQFTNIPLNYLLVESGTSNNYTMEIRLNGELETTLTINSNQPSSYNLMFEDTGKYTLNMKVLELAKEFTSLLDITSYTGKLPIINTNRDDLDLYLNPRGKTNEVIDRDTWTSYDGRYQGYLQDFYYGDINGWFIDENGVSYLKLTQGAKLAIPDYRPFAVNAMDPSRYGVTIELDFKISSVLNYDAELIKCISTDRDGVIYGGFKITGNQAYFYTSIKNGSGDLGEPIKINLVENKRIKLSYVVEKNDVDFPMILSYLDGIVSSVAKYDKADRLIDAGGDGSTPGTILVDSTYAQVDIYGIRVYSSALAQSVILNNFQASLGSLEEREKSYKSNSILDSNNKIDLRLIEDEEYETVIPYIKITGGYVASDNKAMTMGTSGGEFALPVGKKDYRLIDFELIYPKKGYFKEKGYQDFSEKCTFASGNDVTNAFGETPITGCVMYAQGTSSLEYPVKNLRIKFKSNKIPVRPGMAPVNLICLKADFMESSGSHNTGAANWIDTVYQMADLSTPGQAYYKDEDIVTCIKGHPVAVFWSPSGADGTYQYIGKYNLNLDKATPEPFGFKNTPEVYDAAATEKFGWDEEGKNTIRCFEYLDNTQLVCNFIAKEGKTYEETWYELITDEAGKTHYGWTEGFESRHPEDLKGEHDADDIYDMASWVNELYLLPDREQALARFKEEYECYFNKEFLVAYYLITNVLQMTDSRTKNCMMASWGRQPKTYYGIKKDASGKWVRDEETTGSTNFHIWYPIFYDMDTMLGVDNQGYNRLKYYHEDTDPSIFNGEDVLWNFVRDALAGEIATYFDKFESSGAMFTAPVILPYFNDNQANLANEALYNSDAEYKYIDTFRKGYTNHLTGEIIEPGKGTRLYAAQGNRSLNREYFVNNRINFLRAKYQSHLYQTGDRVEFRMYSPAAGEGDTVEERAKIAASIAAVPPNSNFILEGLGYGFVGVRIGQNSPITNHQFKIGEPLTVNIPSEVKTKDTETYLLGLNNLADIGDLSNKYLKSFIIKSSNKLRRIILGNDHKDYYNLYWAKTEGSEVDVQSCYLLEEFNMINCDEYKEALNFNACKQLKKLLLTNCGVTALTLPQGTVIEEMRLPNNLQTLEIKDQTFLNADKFSFGYFEYADGANTMFAEDGSLNGRYVNNYDNLRYVQILNTPIDTYDMVRRGKDLQEYHFGNVHWIIDENDSQYCSTNDTELQESKTYYQYQNGEYIVYEGTEFITGLYEKIDLINTDGSITSIPVLEKLIRMSTKNNIQQSEALSGTLFINVDATVNQFDLYYKYNRIYPNLKFEYGDLVKGEKAYQIEFFRTDIDNMNDNVEADYIVMTNGTKTLAELTGPNSPAGSALFTPVKASTNTEVYTFADYWVDYSDPDKTEYWVEQFTDFKPNKNMKLAPKFIASNRYYKLSLYNDNNEFIWSYESFLYNQNIGQILNSTPNAWYQFKSSDGLEEHQRYTFKGWQSEASFNNPDKYFELYDLNKINIIEDMKMWAYFEVEDASLVATDLKCFKFQERTVVFGDETITGLAININEGYWDQLGGKITLPSKYNGQVIKFIGDFVGPQVNRNYVHRITDIYTLSDAEYVAVLPNAFDMEGMEETQLVNVNLPQTVKYFGERAFVHCLNLRKCTIPDTTIYIGSRAFGSANAYNEMVLELNELPSSLKYLKDNAFYRAGANIKFSVIPAGVEVIESFALSNLPNITINQFGGIGSSLRQIQTQAFRNSGSPSVNTLTFELPVVMIDSDSLFKSLYDEGYASSITTINTHSLFGYESEDAWERALFNWETDRANEITTNLIA